MNVLLVALGPTPPGDGLVAGVEALRRAGATVRLVSRQRPTPALGSALDAVIPLPVRSRSPHPLGDHALPVRYAGPPRLVRLGKLRFSPDRLPGARRLVRHPFTRALVDDADVIVAVDQAALPAVWLAARRNTSAAALNGAPAAVARYGTPDRSA